MSASAHEPGASKDEPLNYAPKKARLAESASDPAGAPPHADAVQKSVVPELAEPPWKRSRQRNKSTFVGDVAITELRTKLALAPDRLPEPPLPSSRGSRLIWAVRVVGIAVVVAVGFVGYRWGSSSSSLVHLLQTLGGSSQPSAPDRPAAAVDSAGGTAAVNTVAVVYPPPAKASARPYRQLTVGPVGVQQIDAAARLAISAADPGPNATVVIGGLAPGSVVSAGSEVAPNTWRLPVEGLAGAFVTPPRGFVGVMDLTLELHLADNSMVDHKGLQLEWAGRAVAARPQPPQRDAAEIAQMVRRGADLMSNGDVAAARLMYQRAAEAGEEKAAFALAETYDPLVLAKGAIAPDVGLAQVWYGRAKELGSAVAPERLERLGRLPQ
jgi:hypothetical protein